MIPRMSTAFLLTSFIIVATPGTGALYTIAAGLARGRRASVVAAFGCTLGIVPHLAAAVTGTAALLHASGVAFETVKILGVAYLLYMAWSTWRDKGVLTVSEQGEPRSAVRVVRSAVLVNLLNPKLTIFFFAFLPQFVPSDSSNTVPAMLLLSGVFMAMTFIVFAMYGIFAAGARKHLIARPHIINRIRRAFAVSFVALGAKLATESR
jgi:threonine/homoserine/homoserine lactone efflux protein